MNLSAFDLKGKVALVTGGAHGIGFSIAAGMAQCGATVCFNCSNEGSLEKGIAAYKEAGIDAHGYVADVTDEAAVNAMIAKIKAEVGPVDILVNNAGLMKRVPMIEMSHADFLRVIDVHVGGAFNCSKAVLPDMIAKREGKIINICSMMSELGRETVSAYAAAKGGLKMLTKNIASEYGEYNIQCNGMGPGYIATAQTAPLRETQPDGSRHPFDTFICAKTPAGRWGDPEDMVGPCVFLASHASDFVNGQILYADGGILAYIGRQPKYPRPLKQTESRPETFSDASGRLFLWSSRAGQIRTISCQFIGSQSILEADGLRAVFIIERDQHSVIVEENGVHKDLNQCLALLLLRYIELSEFHQPESDEVSIKGRLS